MKFPKLSLKDEEFKKAFLEGSFVIDCVDISLTQNGLASPPIYATSGTLLVTPERGLEGSLVFPKGGPTQFNPISWLKAQLQTLSGQFFADSRYFKLDATDAWGRVWTHPAAHVDFEEASGAVTLKVSCDYVSCEVKGQASSPAWTHMVTLDDVEFPLNVIMHSAQGVGSKGIRLAAELSRGRIDGMELSFDPGNRKVGVRYAELHAQADVGATQPVGFQERLMEAVSFVTAAMPSWVMTETEHNGIRTLELFKSRQSNSGGVVHAPLSASIGSNDKHFYALLDCYFKYSCANSSGGKQAPLSGAVGKLFTLKNVWVDTVSLIVSVAVEAILSESEFTKLGMPPKALLDDIEKALQAIEKSGVSLNVIKRVNGSVGQMKSVRAKDKLLVLKAVGAVTKADIDNWDGLRNKTAHGSLRVDPKKLQRLIDDIYSSVALAYKLAFLQIGYNGPFNDYSTHGWGVREFSSSDIKAKLNAPTIPVARRLRPLHQKARPLQRKRRDARQGRRAGTRGP